MWIFYAIAAFIEWILNAVDKLSAACSQDEACETLENGF